MRFSNKLSILHWKYVTCYLTSLLRSKLKEKSAFFCGHNIKPDVHIFTIGFELVVKPLTRHTSFEFQFYPCKTRYVTAFTTATINMESNQRINHGIKNKCISFMKGNQPTLIWNQKSPQKNMESAIT
jgi:hypothetical protein